MQKFINPLDHTAINALHRPGHRPDVHRARPRLRATRFRTWPQASAGSRMRPTSLSVDSTETVDDALRAVRRDVDAARHDRTRIFVTSTEDHLLEGSVAYRDLLAASPQAPLVDVMVTDPLCVRALDDQEVAARLLTEHRLTTLPVVHDGELVGTVAPNDVLDILDAETTEDAERQGGSLPLEVEYLAASPFLLWRKRIVWLLVLFLAEMYTGTVLRHFEDELERVVALMFFVPLLIGTGGNSGTQITTTVVRAMALGQVRTRDVLRVLRKETSTALLVGLTVAALAWVRVLTQGVGQEVAVTVSVTVVAIVLWTSVLASVLPMLLARLRIDPAVVSGPAICTLVDGTGLIIYFTIARTVIEQLG